MKKSIILSLFLIMMFSSCSLPSPALKKDDASNLLINKVAEVLDANTVSQDDKEDVFNGERILSEIFPRIMEQRLAWVLLWEYDIRNFSQKDFRLVKSEDWQIEWEPQVISAEVRAPRQPIYQYSPDKQKWLDVYLGREFVKKNGALEIYNDVDSGVFLYDEQNKQGSGIDSCGTVCTFNDALWLDDSRFVTLGLEADLDETGKTAPTISYYDLNKKIHARFKAIYNIYQPVFNSMDYLKAKYNNNFEEVYRLAQNQADIIPLGYFTDKQTQKEGIAYLKKEYYDYNLYKVIAGQKIKTMVSLADTCRFDSSNYSCFKAVISPDGQYLAYSGEFNRNLVDGGYRAGIVFNLINLAKPEEIIQIESGPGGHYETGDNFFFNEESTKFLYASQAGDENGGGGSVSEYDLKDKSSLDIFHYSNECDLEADTCTGAFYDLLLPIGYASFDSKESPFYIIGQDNKNIVYKDKERFIRYSVEIEIPEIPGKLQISSDSNYIYYLADNTLSMATFGSVLEGENLAGTHSWEKIIAKSIYGGPHGAITDFKLSKNKIIFIDSTGDELCQAETLYSYDGTTKLEIDRQNYCN